MLTEFNEDEIEAFIRFCSFHEDFINQATPLELYIEVLRCKQQYLAIKED
jgi:hypothetical protein